MKIASYSIKGVKKTPKNMPKDWEEKENKALLAQAVRVYEDSMHPGLSKVKSRGEVSTSTRKIYRQKGTGGARHGARSAPIFVGGGKAHGPKGVKRALTLSKAIRQKALRVALSMKVKDSGAVLVEGLGAVKKTKDARLMLDKIASAEKGFENKAKFTICLSAKNKDAYLAFRNLAKVDVIPFKDLNAYKVFFGGVLVVDADAVGEKASARTREIKSEKMTKVEVKRTAVKPTQSKVRKVAGKKADK